MLNALFGMTSESLLDRPEDATPPPAHDPFWYDNAVAPLSGISPERSLQSAAVYSCVRVLAETMGSLPCVYYRRLADGGKEKADDQPMYEVFHDQPNNWQTSCEFYEQMMYHLSLRGNFLADLVSGVRGSSEQLVPIHPDRVKPERLNSDYIRYTISNPNSGKTFTRETGSVLHVRGLSSDGVWGINPIHQLRRIIAAPLAQDEFALRFFIQGVQPSGVIKHPTQLGDIAYGRLLREMAQHRGSPNSHRTLILEEGMEWEQVSMTNRDAQFLESRKFSRSEIAAIFRVPAHMINDMEKATFSNIEHQSLNFVIHTIRPWAVRIEKAFRRDVIVDKKQYFVEFNLDGLLRGDFSSRMTGYATAISSEILTRNEVREMENRNRVEGGDEFKNPNINPNPTPRGNNPAVAPDEEPDEFEEDDAEQSRARRLLVAYSRDIGERIARREVAELDRRVKHAEADSPKFQEWLQGFYEKHAEYIDDAISPLCEATGIRMVDRVALVEGSVKRSCKEILESPEQTVADYADGKLANRYTKLIRGLVT